MHCLCYEFLQFRFIFHSKSWAETILQLMGTDIKTEVQASISIMLTPPQPHLISETITMTTTCFAIPPCSNFTLHIYEPSFTMLRIQINAYLLCITFDWISVYGKGFTKHKKMWYVFGSMFYLTDYRSRFSYTLQYLHHLMEMEHSVRRYGMFGEHIEHIKWKVASFINDNFSYEKVSYKSGKSHKTLLLIQYIIL